MLVVTESGTTYIFEEGRVMRVSALAGSIGMRRDGEWLLVHNTPTIEVGQPIVMTLSGLSPRAIATIRTTTPVVSIEDGNEPHPIALPAPTQEEQS